MAIYLVAPEAGGGPYKIGYAKDPEQRLSQLQVGSPVPLRIVNVLPGDRETEKLLHFVFNGKRSHGEWFNLTAVELQLLLLIHQDGLLVKDKKLELIDAVVNYINKQYESDDSWVKLDAAAIAMGLK